MSYETGWAAMNLEMPERVPHVECSAGFYHFDLVTAVTGIRVGHDVPWETRVEAMRKFTELTDTDLNMGSLVGADVLEKKMSSMGHAAYAVDGADFYPYTSCAFN